MELEAKVDHLKAKLKQMRKEQLKRILFEFTHHNYEKRQGVTLDAMVQALVGEQKA